MFRCSMIYFGKDKMFFFAVRFVLRKENMFCCCIICLWKGKKVSLLHDLSFTEKCYRCGTICPKLLKILLYHVLYSWYPKIRKKWGKICYESIDLKTKNKLGLQHLLVRTPSRATARNFILRRSI